MLFGQRLLAGAMLSNSVRRSSRLSRSLLSRCDSTWTKPQLASELPAPGDARSRVVTCLPGDGVGPEVVRAAQQAVAATGAWGLSVSTSRARLARCGSCLLLTSLVWASGAPIEWETFGMSGQEGSPGYVKTVPKEVMDSIARNKVCLKGEASPPQPTLCFLFVSAFPLTPRARDRWSGGFYTALGGGLSSLNLQIRKARAQRSCDLCTLTAAACPAAQSSHVPFPVLCARRSWTCMRTYATRTTSRA